MNIRKAVYDDFDNISKLLIDNKLLFNKEYKPNLELKNLDFVMPELEFFSSMLYSNNLYLIYDKELFGMFTLHENTPKNYTLDNLVFKNKPTTAIIKNLLKKINLTNKKIHFYVPIKYKLIIQLLKKQEYCTKDHLISIYRIISKKDIKKYSLITNPEFEIIRPNNRLFNEIIKLKKENIELNDETNNFDEYYSQRIKNKKIIIAKSKTSNTKKNKAIGFLSYENYNSSFLYIEDVVIEQQFRNKKIFNLFISKMVQDGIITNNCVILGTIRKNNKNMIELLNKLKVTLDEEYVLLSPLEKK